MDLVECPICSTSRVSVNTGCWVDLRFRKASDARGFDQKIEAIPEMLMPILHCTRVHQ